MAFCPYCGSQIDDSATFCSFCGAKVGGAQEPVRSAPEPEISDPVPAVPEIPDAPAVPIEPTASEVNADPGVFAAPEAPVEAPKPEQPIYSAPAPQQTYAQPAYAQPIYPEQPRKKSKKWLIPVIILAALALIGIAILAFGGSGRAAANDPNLGLYKATTASMYGMDFDVDDIFEGGFTIELQKGGKCRIQAGDEKDTGTWKLEDGKITISDSTSSVEGKISDGVITLENMLDMGLDITLVKVEE